MNGPNSNKKVVRLLAIFTITVLSFSSARPAFGADLAIDRNNSASTAEFLRRRGNSAFLDGNLDAAIAAFERSLESQYSKTSIYNLMRFYALRAQQDARLAERAERVGNLHDARDLRRRERQDRERALRYSEMIFGSGDLVDARVLLTRASLGAAVSKEEFYKLLHALESSPDHAYLAVDGAKFFAAPELLERAIAVARREENLPALAFAIVERKDSSAGELQQAVLMAQEAGDSLLAARGLLYLWDREKDGLYLEQAYVSLKELIHEGASPDSISYFPDIERIHRSYINEILNRGQYQQALDVLQGLTLTEVENLLLADCFVDEEMEAFPGTLVRYIVLPKKTWVLAIEGGEILAAHAIDLPEAELDRQVRDFYLRLTTYGDETFTVAARELYDLLFAPIADAVGDLERLVVVPDGTLRTIPFSVLYDGDRFLVERFALATALSHEIQSEEFVMGSGVFLGVSEHSELPSLPWVEFEAESSQLPVQLTQDVSYADLQQHVGRNPSILHVATHGRFYGSPNRSWLQFSDRAINAVELQGLLAGHDIDLLVLAACQTAAGDARAALGFHSLALRARVGRVLGSVWAFREIEGAGLMKIFYEGLHGGLSPEAALRNAQRAAIARQLHPAGWAGLQVFIR